MADAPKTQLLRDPNRPVSRWTKFLTTERSPARRYTAAVLFALTSLSIAHLLEPFGGTQLSALAILSVVASAIYGGRGPAMLDTAITAVVIDYFYSDPLFSMFLTWQSYTRLLIFGAVGYVVANLVASLREAYRALYEQHREAEMAKAAREYMLAIVSHDLRSPLSALSLNVDVLRRAGSVPLTDAKAATAIERIRRSADLMNRLIEDLLDAAKMEAGQFRIEPKNNDILPIIEDATESVRAAASAKSVKIVSNITTDKHRAYCDRDRLTQAVSNLLNNAVKFAPGGSDVNIDVRANGEWMQIDVRDAGPGIAPENLPRLFTRYWQARETAHKGTGLGLYITKNVIDAHGGKVTVSSEIGHGATFSIRLPGAPDDISRASEQQRQH